MLLKRIISNTEIGKCCNNCAGIPHLEQLDMKLVRSIIPHTIDLSKSNLKYFEGKLDDEIFDCSHPSSNHKCPESKCEFDNLFQQVTKLLETTSKGGT